MTDSDPRETEAVPTTTFLPDHLVAGGTAGIEAAATDESADRSEGESGGASEFCQSWRSHLAGSGSQSPF